jgi:outer membrane immunogenic protein
MTRFFLATAAGLALLSGTALAADLPPAPAMYKAPPVMAPVYNWTGCYLNAGYGYGMWNQDHAFESNPGLVPISGRQTSGGRGWMGLAGAGCDFQVPVGGLGNAVIGVMGDYDFMNIHGVISDSGTVLQGDEKESSAWAVGGRVGLLVTPQFLTYFNGGYTQTHFNQVNMTSVGIGPVIAFVPSHTFHGWFLGGGTEYALSFLPIQGLFWRNEYRFSSFSSADLPILAAGTGVPFGVGFHQQYYTQTIMSSLVWRFNFH